jgi:hypothetical protein
MKHTKNTREALYVLEDSIHLVSLAFRFRSRVHALLSWLISETHDPAVEKYIREHGLKSAPWAHIQRLALCTQILWSNLDKILDFLDPDDPRFFWLLEYFTLRILSWNPQNFDPLLEHPKMKELELLVDEVVSLLHNFPGKAAFKKHISRLYRAVIEQRRWTPALIPTSNTDGMDQLLKRARDMSLPQSVIQSMYLSVRLGVHTVMASFGVNLYRYPSGNEKEDRVREFLVECAAFTQIYDDFLDQEKDAKKWVYTYATNFPEYTSQYAWMIQMWKSDLEKKYNTSVVPLPKSLLRVIRSYSFLNHLWPKDSAKCPPYDLPL